ncbi:MAG: hypothetical protein U0795_00370 [Pirellulales bacterium]
MRTMEERVEKLEGDCRRLRAANWCLLAAGLGLMCMAAVPGPPPQQSEPAAVSPEDKRAESTDGPGAPNRQALALEVQQLVVIDAQHRPRIQMSVVDDGPTIRLLDSAGKPQVILGQNSSWAGLQLTDSQGEPTGSLTVSSGTRQAQLELRGGHGSSLVQADGFFVRDVAGHNGAYLAILNGNFPVCGVTSPGIQGPPSVEITSSGRTGRIKIHDSDGRPLFTVGTTEQRSAELTLSQAGSERSINIEGGTAESDGPVVTFLGPAQSDGSGGILPRLTLGIAPDSAPFIRITDADGKRSYTVPPATE